MSKARSKVLKELLEWIGDDPFKEALLITEAPIGRTTLMQIKAGNYSPSERMIKALLGVKSKFPEGLPQLGGPKATGA